MIKNKNAILISPPFFHYEDHIKNELERMGYKVFYLNHKKGRIQDALISFLPQERLAKLYEKVLYNRLEKLSKENIDLLFLIKGDFVLSGHIDYLRKIHPQIKCIMYQWDSVDNFNYLSLSRSFDKVFTFDFKDSEIFSLEYLPLFYTNDIVCQENGEEDIDFLLIGTYNPLRYKYFLKLKNIAEKNNLSLYSYILIPPIYYFKKQLLKKELCIKSIKDIHFFSLSRRKLIKYYQRAKVIVDVCMADQTGLSMRMIESYGLNKKVLTSNINVDKDPIVKEIARLSTESTEEEILNFVDFSNEKYENRLQLSIHCWIERILSK